MKFAKLTLAISMLGMAARATVSYLNYDCYSCISVGGRQCLLNGDLTYGTCCNPSQPYHLQSSYCKSQP